MAALRGSIQPGSAALRQALRSNVVCFPSPVPILLKRLPADMQWRMVLLFFVRGWSSASIAERFHVPKHRIKTSLHEWSCRALALGHVQVIDPDAFVEICQLEAAEPDAAAGRCQPSRGEFEMQLAAVLRGLGTAAAAPGAGAFHQELSAGGEERVSYAVV